MFEIFAHVRCDHGAIDLVSNNSLKNEKKKSSRSYILLQFRKGEKCVDIANVFKKTAFYHKDAKQISEQSEQALARVLPLSFIEHWV